MADGIYVSMCGAVARAEQLEAIADNLANGQTPGFKAARPAFESFMAASGAPEKAYPAAVATGFDLRAGPRSGTGNPLDVLPEGNAFLAVRTASGEIAYTRDGRLTLDDSRRLVSGGHPVLSRDGSAIRVPQNLVPVIDERGVVRAGELELGTLALSTLGGPVDRTGPALLSPAAGGLATPVETGVHVGEIELGNAGALEATIQLVTAQRSYETSMQAIQTYRQLDQRAVELGKVR